MAHFAKLGANGKVIQVLALIIILICLTLMVLRMNQ